MRLSSDEVRTIARQLLRTTTQCRHCNGTADLEYINDGFVGVHVCPGRYVTRIITYGKQPNPKEFKRFVQEAVQDSGNVEDSDIRVGRRYAWDLGLDRKSNDLILTETYWTQNYRRTKNDDPNRPALFLCSNKDAFYVQPLTSTETLCPSCRK